MKKTVTAILVCALVCSVFAFAFQASALENFCVGDTNNSGTLDVSDARLALRIAAKMQKPSQGQLERADIDSNGVIDLADVYGILRAALGISRYQRTGAFFGFDGGGYFDSAEELLEYFNYNLNEIKKQDAGFIAESDAVVDALSMKDIVFRGYAFESPDIFEELLKNELTSSFESDDPIMYVLGSDNDYAIEAIGQDYVSLLGVDDVCGVKAEYDGVNEELTVSVSLYDISVQAAASSASYAKALNISNMNVISQGTVSRLFGKLTTPAVQEYANVTLTAKFHEPTGKVVFYEVAYDNDVRIASAGVNLAGIGGEIGGIGGIIGSIISANVTGLEYSVRTITQYTDFQWPLEDN